MRIFMHRMLTIAMVLCLMLPCASTAEVLITILDENGDNTFVEAGGEADVVNDGAAAVGDEADAEQPTDDGLADGAEPASDASSSGGEARAAFIDDIIALAKREFDDAHGRAQRAQYSGDIYVCKNFTVYLFRQNCDKFRMAEFPDTPLVIPDNKPKKECTDYVYGAEWKSVPASEGNPFEVAASFRYDKAKSKDENRQAAREFLMQVKKGDYFQMAAKYYYGTGAHSMVFIADYDAATDSVRWCDSNMKGEKRDGIRYGYVQFDAVKEIDWFVDAFCRVKYGATLYRLRDDIIYAK